MESGDGKRHSSNARDGSWGHMERSFSLMFSYLQKKKLRDDVMFWWNRHFGHDCNRNSSCSSAEEWLTSAFKWLWSSFSF